MQTLGNSTSPIVDAINTSKTPLSEIFSNKMVRTSSWGSDTTITPVNMRRSNHPMTIFNNFN